MDLKYTKFKLPNGLHVVMVPRKETKAVSVNVIFSVGSRYEKKENNGVAHFLEHMAFKGTEKRPTQMDVSKEIDQVGGSFNAGTGSETTAYWIRLHSGKIELAFDILSDMIINSKFSSKEIEKEKGVIIEEFKRKFDSPEALASVIFDKIAYGDTPLGRMILGTEETIKSMDRKKIVDFYRKFYNPNNAVIAIGGNINQKKTKELLKKYFGKLKGETKDVFEKNCVCQEKPIVKIHKKDFKQASLIMGFRAFEIGHKDEYIRNIMSKVLGGYMSSRLFTEIREKRGLAYHVFSWYETYHDTGFFGIAGGLNPKNTPEATREILKILRDIKKNGLTEKELKMAKENTIGKLALSLEGAGSWAEDIAMDIVYGVPTETPDEIIERINKVSNKDIKRLANELFVPEKFNMVIVGPIDEKKEKEYLKMVKL